MAGYVDFQTQNDAPGWLLTPRGRGWLTALGKMKDATGQRTREAVLARLPTHAPVDALGYQGESRQMEQYPGESVAAFRARLKDAWRTWKDAGTALGVLRQLWLYTLNQGIGAAAAAPVTITIQQGIVYTYDHTTDSVVVDKRAPRQFLSPNLWNSFLLTFENPSVWDSMGIPDDTSDEANGVRRIVKRWKPAYAICAGILIRGVDSPVWGGLDSTGARLTWGVHVGDKWGSAGNNVRWTPPT